MRFSSKLKIVAASSALKYKVVVENVDGEHIIEKNLTKEDAIKAATKWLDHEFVENDNETHVSNYGGVVHIDRHTSNPEADKLIDMISGSWSTDPDELAWENEYTHELGKIDSKGIDELLDFLIENGVVKHKEASSGWKNRIEAQKKFPTQFKQAEEFFKEMDPRDPMMCPLEPNGTTYISGKSDQLEKAKKLLDKLGWKYELGKDEYQGYKTLKISIH